MSKRHEWMKSPDYVDTRWEIYRCTECGYILYAAHGKSVEGAFVPNCDELIVKRVHVE